MNENGLVMDDTGALKPAGDAQPDVGWPLKAEGVWPDDSAGGGWDDSWSDGGWDGNWSDGAESGWDQPSKWGQGRARGQWGQHDADASTPVAQQPREEKHRGGIQEKCARLGVLIENQEWGQLEKEWTELMNTCKPCFTSIVRKHRSLYYREQHNSGGYKGGAGPRSSGSSGHKGR